MKFGKVFEKEKVFLPVIHVKGMEQAHENARIAYEEGADGVFLISHGEVQYDTLTYILGSVKNKMPQFWVGANYLDLSLDDALEEARSYVDGLWFDSIYPPGYSMMMVTPPVFSERVRILGGDFKGCLFGGVAFKYQAQPVDVSLAASEGKDYVDVVTTSGSATGESPSVDKIQTMKQALGEHPLAIASGMTPDNVRMYLEHADSFLVSTGISKKGDFYNLDPQKVGAFVKKIK